MQVKKKNIARSSLGILGLALLATSEVVHADVIINNPNPTPTAPTNSGSRTIEFDAQGKQTSEVTVRKSMDLLAIVDMSGSMYGNVKPAMEYFKTIIDKMGDKDRIMIATYGSNTGDSYAVGYLNEAKATRLLTKEEASDVIRKMDYPFRDRMFEGYALDLEQYRNLSENGAGSVIKVPYEKLYEAQSDRNDVVSVLQVTDNWQELDRETIDTSFAEWAKKKAKTFMSVLIAPATENSLSYKEMVKAGHDNIYIQPNKQIIGKMPTAEDLKIVGDQFDNTAVETELKKTNANARVSVTPNNLTVKNVRLQDANGKEVALTKQGDNFVYNGELADGKYRLSYDYEGTGDVTGKVQIDDQEVAKEKDVLGTNHTVSFKVVDEKGNQIGNTYPVAIGANGTSYTIIPPTAEGYNINIKQGDSLTGTISGDKTVTFIATPKIVKTTRTETIPYETEVIKDITVPKGERRTKQNGVNGEVLIHLENGVEVRREVTKQPIKEIIIEGALVKSTKTEVIPYETEEIDDPTLMRGERVTQTKGVNGITTIHLENDIEVSREVTTKPVTEVVRVGTKEIGAKVTATYHTIDSKQLKSPTIVSDDNNLFVGVHYRANAILIIRDENGLLWRLTKTPVNHAGKITRDEQQVNFIYEPVPGEKVTVNYVTESGKVLKEPTVVTNKEQIGSSWSLGEVGPSEIKDDNGDVWVLKQVKGDTSGLVTDEDSEVTFVYEKVVPEVKPEVKPVNPAPEVKPEIPKVEEPKPVDPIPEVKPKPVDPIPEVKPEVPKEEQPEIKPEEPKIDVPKEEPKVEQPEVKPEIPKVEEPEVKPTEPTPEVKPEAPTIEEPKIETPEVKPNAPKAEEPKVEVPKVEQPEIKPDVPEVETPKEEPEVLKQEAPKALPKVEAKQLPKTGDESSGLLAGLVGLLVGIGLLRRKKED